MKPKIRLGISPCPNDTFMFYGLLHQKVPHPFDIQCTIQDVEELNQMVLTGTLDVSKVSYHLAGLVQDRYSILDAGSALGWGCGPLVVTRDLKDASELKGQTIAIPGRYTTAHLLLRLFEPDIGKVVPVLFSKIPILVKNGGFKAGLIIHESRFTYEILGLRLLVDLGRWWEEKTGLPIPLGGIVARKGLLPVWKRDLEDAIRSSINYAWNNMEEVMEFMKAWAKELDEQVIKRHVALYVNDFSLSLGRTGKKAVDFLLGLGIEKGIFQGPERNETPNE